MSIRVMSNVWKNSAAKGSTLLLLLAIADYAHDDGGGAYPSVKTLSEKIRMTERNVQLLTKKLEKLGELEVLRIGAPDRTNIYRVKTFQDGEIQGIKPFKKIPQISPKPSVNNHHTTITKGTELLECYSEEEREAINSKFTQVDIEWEANKCVLWYKEKKRTMRRPKSAFMNWLDKAKPQLFVATEHGTTNDPYGPGGEYEGMQPARISGRR